MAYIIQDDDDQKQAALAAANAAQQPAPSTDATSTPIAGSGNPSSSTNNNNAPTLQSDSTNVSAGGATGGSGTTTNTPAGSTSPTGQVSSAGTTTQQAAPDVATYNRIQSLNADQATQLANNVANQAVKTQSGNLSTAANQANSAFQGEIAPDIFNNDAATQATVNNDLTTPQTLAPSDISQFQTYLGGYTGPTSISATDLAPLTAAQSTGDQYFQNLNTDAGRQSALQDLYHQTMNGASPTTGESAFDSMLLQNNNTINPIFNTANQTFDTNATNATNNLNTQAAGEVSNAQASDKALQDYINSQYGTTNTNFQNTINSAVTQDQSNYAAQQAALNAYLSGLTPGATAPNATPDELSALGLSQDQINSLTAAEAAGTTINPLTYLNQTAPTYNPNTVATSDQVAYYQALQSLMEQPNSFLNAPGSADGSTNFDYQNALAAANVKPTVNPTVGPTQAVPNSSGGSSAAVTAGAALGALSGIASIINVGGKLYNAINGKATTPFSGTPAQATAINETAEQQAADAATSDQAASEAAQDAYSAPDSALDGSAEAEFGGYTPTAGDGFVGYDADGVPVDEYGDELDLNSGDAIGGGAGSSIGTALGAIGAAYAIYNAISSYQSGATGSDAMNGATAGASVGSLFGPIGTAVGAVVGAAVGAIASAFGGGKVDPETAIANNYTSAVTANGSAAADTATPQQNFEALAGYFDAKNNTPGHSEPAEQVYGRMQEGAFMSDVLNQVNTAIKSGVLPPNATAQQAYSQIITPYLTAKKAAPATTGEGAAFSTAVTELIGQWMSGALTGSTAVGISGQTMGSQVPAYAGSSAQVAAAAPTVAAVNKQPVFNAKGIRVA